MFHKFKNFAIAKLLIYNETAKFLVAALVLMDVADDSGSSLPHHTWLRILP